MDPRPAWGRRAVAQTGEERPFLSALWNQAPQLVRDLRRSTSRTMMSEPKDWKVAYEREKARADAQLAKHEGCIAETQKSFDECLNQCLDRAEKAEAALAAARRECEGLRRALRRVLEIRADPAVLQAPDSVHNRLCELGDVARAALAAPADGEGGKR